MTAAEGGVQVRPEEPADHAAITEVVRAAFKGEAEAQLVEGIRASPEYLPSLALVAELHGRIVGHVMVSHAALVDGERRHRIATLSPLAVAPDLHRRGIGSLLVREVTSRADEEGEPLVVLEGSPAYYGRFGFEPAAGRGIHIELPGWAPPEAAQVLPLSRYDPTLRGTVEYPPAFGAVLDH